MTKFEQNFKLFQLKDFLTALKNQPTKPMQIIYPQDIFIAFCQQNNIPLCYKNYWGAETILIKPLDLEIKNTGKVVKIPPIKINEYHP